MDEDERARFFKLLHKVITDATLGNFDPKKGGFVLDRIDDEGVRHMKYVPPLPKEPD